MKYTRIERKAGIFGCPSRSRITCLLGNLCMGTNWAASSRFAEISARSKPAFQFRKMVLAVWNLFLNIVSTVAEEAEKRGGDGRIENKLAITGFLILSSSSAR